MEVESSIKEINTKLNRVLYPPANLLRKGTLAVDSVHSIYYEEYGRPDDDSSDRTSPKVSTGKIALSLHGGPGAGCYPKHAQFFDPERYHRIILFDQRGCGKSTPRGETRSNTLKLLVEDIESLRIHLGVRKFDVILGGSWGSTLALAYAQSFPSRVGSMILRGVCLFRSQEIDWLFGNHEDIEATDEKTFCISNKKEFASGWETFVKGVSNRDDEHNDIVSSSSDGVGGTKRILHKYYHALLGPDPVVRASAAKSWFQWEMGVSSAGMAVDNTKMKEFGDVLVWRNAQKAWICSHVGREEEGIVAATAGARAGATKGEELIQGDVLGSSLRKWPTRLQQYVQTTTATTSSSHATIVPIDSNPTFCNDAKDTSKDDADKFIPAQAMLTCFYSVNHEFMMKHFNLLQKENIDRIRHIPCISVQGANDLICPPDSALDLVEAWPEMECRIVMQGKHSMYDPKILSELIDATDRLGDIGNII